MSPEPNHAHDGHSASDASLNVAHAPGRTPWDIDGPGQAGSDQRSAAKREDLGEASDDSRIDGPHQPVILVVEDDEPIAEAIALLLEDVGYRATWAPNGRAALDAARRQWPSLVLTDLMMPHMDGTALIKALRVLAGSLGRAMPPVVLTTAADVSARRVKELGVDAVVLKPFDVRDLQALITRLVKNTSAH